MLACRSSDSGTWALCLDRLMIPLQRHQFISEALQYKARAHCSAQTSRLGRRHHRQVACTALRLGAHASRAAGALGTAAAAAGASA
ncbi:hypothetical protein PsYK624_066250 [Phanerochaete sordida]|uniref:Uncharacterized protein n=1 Tax=Phanerochaete sordida TaxID=48140 RepID=A0A9P3G728_9APHY|nr:hypothetical protein PsYK624_066250 [Phanerochaete sordida]